MEEQKTVYTFADILFSPLKIGEEQKQRSTPPQMFFFSLRFSTELNKKKKRSSASVSAHGPHKMVLQTALSPPLPYAVIQALVYYLHFYISKKLVANYASIAKLKMIIQKIQHHEQRVVYFSVCSI